MSGLQFYGVGNAVAEPNLREINGSSLVSVNLAFNRSIKRGDNYEKEVTFVEANLWGRRAEKFAELVHKGDPVYVCGVVRQQKWEKEGKKMSRLTLAVNDFHLAQRFTNGNNNNKAKTGNTNEEPEVVQTADELPF